MAASSADHLDQPGNSNWPTYRVHSARGILTMTCSAVGQRADLVAEVGSSAGRLLRYGAWACRLVLLRCSAQL